ncbi:MULTISPECIES: hypothetical protein [unclassified Herbaspirillum]|jgi:hypothetical protein|uniref:hypothetical protein n=1 Tax=unclassified Herbaspirillum TaxID=2624150 RepID=UPI0002EF7123|nr:MULTISPECIES: hypothetical protein [unclassified Herbaspirillum]MCI1006560.1 hypothetical protein [Herbaspirillum sp. C7C8]
MTDALNRHTHPADTSGPQDLQTKGNQRNGTSERDMLAHGRQYAPGDSDKPASRNKPEGDNYSEQDMRENSPQL